MILGFIAEVKEIVEVASTAATTQPEDATARVRCIRDSALKICCVKHRPLEDSMKQFQVVGTPGRLPIRRRRELYTLKGDTREA